MSQQEKREELDESIDLTEPLIGVESKHHSSTSRYQRLYQIQWMIILILCIALISLLGYLQFNFKSPSFKTQVYSPVDHLISYKDVVFSTGFDKQRTIYEGPPTPENEAAWQDLYDFGISRIPESSAAKLVNKTVPIPDDPGYYVVELNVFHQLHCLNMLRKRLYTTESFDDQDLLGLRHLEHCVDAIRQNLMCSVDVAPHSWAWEEESQQSKAVAGILHTCRDFEVIKQWAKENQVDYFNKSVHP